MVTEFIEYFNKYKTVLAKFPKSVGKKTSKISLSFCTFRKFLLIYSGILKSKMTFVNPEFFEKIFITFSSALFEGRC